MTAGVLVQRARRRMQEEIASLTTILASDRCASMEDYKRIVGMIKGLTLAEHLLVQAAEAVERSSDN